MRQKVCPHNATGKDNCQWTHGSDRCPELALLWESGRRRRWCWYHERVNVDDPVRATEIMHQLLRGEKPVLEVSVTGEECLERVRRLLAEPDTRR